MRSACLPFLVLLAATSVELPLPDHAHAQSAYVNHASDRTITADIGHVFFKDDESTGTSAAVTLSTRLRMGGFFFLADLPIAFRSGGDSGSSIGNIFVGAEIPVSRYGLELGVRLPTNSGAEFSGFDDAFVNIDMLEAYSQDAISFRGVFRDAGPAEGIGLTWHAGAVHTRINRDEDAFSEDFNETILTYGVGGVKRSSRLALGAGLMGRLIASDAGENASIGDRSLHMVNAWAQFGSGTIRPGAYVRIPLDSDLTEFIRAVAGVQVQVILR